ncbi:MAG: adenosyl-hopene transferase HpnH [Deferrisomatales bacterium]
MAVPWIQRYRLAAYLLGRKLRGVRRYPLVLMLEPLFRCNLSCPGCGKVGHPPEVLARTLSAEECLGAAEECGAPVVSIAGGEPLLHPEMPRIVAGLERRRKFTYLCTNALLLEQKLADYRPSAYLTFSVHLDGGRERHDATVGRAGSFDAAVAAIRRAVSTGFRVNVNCTLFRGQRPEELAGFFDFVMGLGVEGITVSPGFDYEQAPGQGVFLSAGEAARLFRRLLSLGRERRWRFNHTGLFLDFLCGNQPYRCTPWGNPARNVFGWQRPCYLLPEGHAPTFRSLLEDTDWDRYGRGRDPRCANCMMHCGFEPTAVDDACARPFKALAVWWRGPGTGPPASRTAGPQGAAAGTGPTGEGGRGTR